MKKKTFSEEQIALALRQAEGGTPVTEVCRKLGVSEQSFYWNMRHNGNYPGPRRREFLTQRSDQRRGQFHMDELSLSAWKIARDRVAPETAGDSCLLSPNFLLYPLPIA